MTPDLRTRLLDLDLREGGSTDPDTADPEETHGPQDRHDHFGRPK